MGKVGKFIVEEIISIIPVVIFFIIAFNLIVLSEKLMITHNPPSYLTYTIATITALVVGKVVLIVNAFPFINLFPNKPLIYNISWKFLIYAFFILFFRLLDKYLHFYFMHDRNTVIYDHIKTIVSSTPFWAVQVWILMVFLIYIVASEYTRVLGEDKILTLLFGVRKRRKVK